VSKATHPSSGSRAATSSTSSELDLIERLKRQPAGPLFAAVSDRSPRLGRQTSLLERCSVTDSRHTIDRVSAVFSQSDLQRCPAQVSGPSVFPHAIS
jgi:hypothetical protein